MDMQAILTDYVRKEFLHGRGNAIDPSDDLLDSGIINSIGLLKLVAFVEENLDIEVPPEDVVYENFHSIAALTAYLESHQA